MVSLSFSGFGNIVKDVAWDVRRVVRRLELDVAMRGTLRAEGHKAPTEPGSDCRTLFIDVTVIAANDAGTGIQRVVRALALALVRQPAASWRIQFVRATRKRPYRHISWPNPAKDDLRTLMVPRPGDIFLGLDYALDAVRRHWRQLAHFRRRGGALWFLIHDLLPMQRPDWFSQPTVRRYRAWLEILDRVADGFLCNSAQTESDLQDALRHISGHRRSHRTVVLPMGHDISETVHHPIFRSGDARPFLEGVRFFLSVGTIEPRKGHGDILDAFDVLWRRGSDRKLVFIGRRGWHVEQLLRQIHTHPEFTKKLLWLDDADDATLLGAYQACEGVIIASHGEGFGLPLIEALGHRRPVLARDLPIFRPHEENGVWFFAKDADAETFADRIEEWEQKLQAGAIQVVPPTGSWEGSARELMCSIGMTPSAES